MFFCVRNKGSKVVSDDPDPDPDPEDDPPAGGPLGGGLPSGGGLPQGSPQGPAGRRQDDLNNFNHEFMNTFNCFTNVLERLGFNDSKSKVKEPELFDGNNPCKLRSFLVNVHLNLNDCCHGQTMF